MKKISVSFSAVFFLLSAVWVAPASAKVEESRYHASGEVTSVDPLYSRITIQHGAIEGLSGDTETEFFVGSPELLKEIVKRDLVDFEILDHRGDMKIDKITKTGEAPPKDDRTPVGKAMQDVVVGAGEVMKGASKPIEPIHEVVGSAVGATTNATGAVLNEASPDVKKKF